MNCDDAVGSSDGSCIISNVVHVILQVACFRQSLEYHLVVYYLVLIVHYVVHILCFLDATLYSSLIQLILIWKVQRLYDLRCNCLPT